MVKKFKEFTTEDLLRNLEEPQRTMSLQLLEKDGDCCTICGDKPAKQIIMNGYPAQLCDDCIKIQSKEYQSTHERL